MPQKLTVGKAQKMNLVLSQTVTALRVNERLMCRLLQWAATHSQDPHQFIESAMEQARNDLRRAGDDGSTVSAIAADEALEYLDHLANEIKAGHGPKRLRHADARMKGQPNSRDAAASSGTQIVD